MPRKILVLSRDQGAHEVDGAGPDDRQGVRGVIPFVEDEGDVGHPLGERLTAGQELLGHALEGHRVVLIARVGVMEERDLTIGGDQEGEAQQPEIGPALLAVAPLRQRGARVEAIEEGEKVGGVEQQTPEIQAEPCDGCAGQLVFDSGDVLPGDAGHVVPEPLARELAGGQGQKAPEGGLRVPVPDLGLAARGHTAVQGGDQEVRADGGPLPAPLGHVAVDDSDDLKGLSQREHRGRSAEFGQRDLRRFGAQEAVQEALRGAEVDGGDDLGLAVDALGLAQVVIGLAADDLLGEAGHRR
jgi:hypothetical protein